MLNPNIDLDAQEQLALAAINPKAVLELVRRVRAAEAQILPLRHELAKAKAISARKMRRESKHPDDAAVDRFAEAMKAKLAAARAKGRGGWEDPEQCSTEFLADLFVGHLRKDNPGNIEDLANLLMMLHQRQAPLTSIKDAMLRCMNQDLAALQSDLDEADRRAGAAERAKAHLEEEVCRRKAWLVAAKREAGYPDNVSLEMNTTFIDPPALSHRERRDARHGVDAEQRTGRAGAEAETLLSDACKFRDVG